MRGKLFLLSGMFLIIFLSCSIALADNNSNNNEITGKAITGKASFRVFNLSILVTPSLPVLQLIRPENETYLRNYTLLLNFSAANYQAIWYNLDNGNNITTTSPGYFNASDGTHTLYIYANNSDGVVSKNVTFIVNSTRLIILYTHYNQSNETTDFYSYSYEDLLALLNTILRNQYGEIRFNEDVDVVADLNPLDNLVDFDNNTNISFNRIEVNLTALPNLNKSATLYLYNLTFINPRILKDNVVCPLSICTILSYSGGTLIFNVTHFTVYSAEETPTEVPSAPSAGGGAGPSIKRDFSIDRSEIRLSLKQGESKTESIIITNTGDEALDFRIFGKNLDNILKITGTNFRLEKGESKTVYLEFKINENLNPNLYLGNIVVSADSIEKQVFVAVDVKSKIYPFEVKLEIPSKYQAIMPDEELFFRVYLYNLENKNKQDVFMEYIIKDIYGNIIVSDSEMLYFADALNFFRSLKIPADANLGRYILYVRASQNARVASSSIFFTVGPRVEVPLSRTCLFCVLIIIVLSLIVFLLWRRRKKQDEDNEEIERGEMEKRLHRYPFPKTCRK